MMNALPPVVTVMMLVVMVWVTVGVLTTGESVLWARIAIAILFWIGFGVFLKSGERRT